MPDKKKAQKALQGLLIQFESAPTGYRSLLDAMERQKYRPLKFLKIDHRALDSEENALRKRSEDYNRLVKDIKANTDLPIGKIHFELHKFIRVNGIGLFVLHDLRSLYDRQSPFLPPKVSAQELLNMCNLLENGHKRKLDPLLNFAKQQVFRNIGLDVPQTLVKAPSKEMDDRERSRFFRKINDNWQIIARKIEDHSPLVQLKRKRVNRRDVKTWRKRPR